MSTPGTDDRSDRPGVRDVDATRRARAVDEGGPPAGEGWSLTFRDEFDQGALDWDTWEVGFGPSNQKSCAASACAFEENVHVDATTDRLVLTTTEGADEIPRDEWLANYTTGAVTTGTNVAQTYGYFEAKAKIPAQPGGLPAFWAWGTNGNPPEIDFYEVFGASPREITTTVHVRCTEDSGMVGRGGRSTTDECVDESFHVIGCEWAPDHVAWFLDGSEVHRVEAYVETCLTPEPMFPILSTHVGGREGDFVGPGEVGDPTEAEYPYTHEFDWIRAWQREEWA